MNGLIRDAKLCVSDATELTWKQVTGTTYVNIT